MLLKISHLKLYFWNQIWRNTGEDWNRKRDNRKAERPNGCQALITGPKQGSAYYHYATIPSRETDLWVPNSNFQTNTEPLKHHMAPKSRNQAKTSNKTPKSWRHPKVPRQWLSDIWHVNKHFCLFQFTVLKGRNIVLVLAVLPDFLELSSFNHLKFFSPIC